MRYNIERLHYIQVLRRGCCAEKTEKNGRLATPLPQKIRTKIALNASPRCRLSLSCVFSPSRHLTPTSGREHNLGMVWVCLAGVVWVCWGGVVCWAGVVWVCWAGVVWVCWGGVVCWAGVVWVCWGGVVCVVLVCEWEIYTNHGLSPC